MKEEKSVVLQECPETRIYWNEAGSICIYQPSDNPYGEDGFVHFPPEYVPKIIKALQEKIEEAADEQ